MAIQHVVTRGYGTGTLLGVVTLLPTRGYMGAAAAPEPSVALSGTASSGLTEAEVVAGGKTIVLTLTGDTWVAAGATFDAVRQAIIDGMTSSGSETNGWNAEVRDNEVVGAVVRTSDTVVTITLSAAAGYNVTAAEVVTVTVPASALVIATDPVVASPSFVVGVNNIAAGRTLRRSMGPRLRRRVSI